MPVSGAIFPDTFVTLRSARAIGRGRLKHHCFPAPGMAVFWYGDPADIR